MKAVSFGITSHVSAYRAQFLVSAYTQYGLRKLTAVNKGENIFYFLLAFDRPTPYNSRGKGKLPYERRKRNLKKFQKGLDKRYPKAL